MEVPLIEPPVPPRLIRWWVLAVFSYASFLLALVWNTWGPVATASEAVYGWDDGTVAMFGGWGNIAYIVFAVPVSLFMDAKGMRSALRVCSVMVLVGTGLRCLPVADHIATWMAYLCAVLNGIALPVTFGGPALVSATWFPENERVTAIGIATFFNYLGISMEFILGPQIVSDPIYSNSNLTNLTGVESHTEPPGNGSRTQVLMNLSSMRDEIHYLMYVRYLITPTNLGEVRNIPLWLVVMAYSVPTGSLAGWSSVLAVNLQAINISQIDAGWMGFFNTIGGCVAGLLLAYLADKFPGNMLKTLVVCLILASVSSAWFTALCNSYLPFSKPSLYAACILAGVFINGTIPLFYEVATEAASPVPEGLTGGILTLLNNVIGMFFLLVLSVPSVGTVWMNWCLLGSTVIALPILLVFRLTRTPSRNPDSLVNSVP